MNRDELAGRLLLTFIAELEEQLRAMNADLLALEGAPADAARLKALFRGAHTLKGAAWAAQIPMVGEVCHALETLLAEARDGQRVLGSGEFALLFAAVDALAQAGRNLSAGEPLARSELADLLERLGTPGPAAAPPAPPGAPSGGGVSEAFVRVPADQLDALLAAASQVLVTSGRATSLPAELEALHDQAVRCVADWQRAGRHARRALERVDGPDTVKALNTLDESLRGLARESGRVAADAATRLRAIAQVAEHTTDRARRLRMRPFADACEALPRAVRDLAGAAGKEVQLRLTGTDVQADRAVLDGLREAVLHLVRNAIDHGIEPPANRERAGKSPTGTVTVGAELRGSRILVTVADDGAGLDIAAVRARLAEAGRPAPAADQDVARALFDGGISTRGEVTPISGRGVGLDLVRAAVRRIDGDVRVDWHAGQRTTFTIDCPPSLATIRALLVGIGAQILAIPSSQVARVVRVPLREVRRAEGRDMILTADGPVPVVPLERLLPPLTGRPPAGSLLAVLLGSDRRRLAVSVDEVLTEQELMLRPLGSASDRLPLVSGAALLPSGHVAVVLNPAVLLRDGLNLAPGAGPALAGAATDVAPARRVLVVDDSLTTRTLERSLLEAAGYDVQMAVDGADGWKMLQEEGADLVVTDIEMPRMDGFRLCELIRGSRRFRELPIVLVTALESAEHRARGLECGASAYLGKSSFD